MPSLLRITVAVLVCLCVPACRRASPVGQDSTGSAEEKLNVVATTGMVADLVREVGGQHVQVTQLIGSGVDPHLHKPSRDDVVKLSRADLVVYSGLMLEGKLADTLDRLSSSQPVIAVTRGLDPEVLLNPSDASGHADPHVWMDVSAWSACLDQVRKALSDILPEHAEAFRENSAAYAERLSRLHRYGQERLATVPADRRVLITSHDAFNYFGRAYGLEVLGVQGLSTESEAGLQQINELVDLLVRNEIAAVFVESSVDPRNIQALIEGAASRGHQVRVGGELFSDAMGTMGTYEGTYVGMLDHNITTVTRALGGEAPRQGMLGKLMAAPEAARPGPEDDGSGEERS